MTTPMVDTVRTIPLIVENCVPMVVDDAPNDDDSGFPFDRDTRDESLRSQLDDIAKRHPEFAEHLEGFPFRSNRTRPPRPSDEAEFRRFRPFGSSRFERFGFPFSRDPFEEDYQRPEEYQSRSETTSQSPPPPPTQHQKETQEKQTQTLERGRQKPIQQSNTVDLGQKQEPVNDRNQRSMSAPPPDNRSGQKRYVSSINIPINRDGGMGDMGTQQSQPQQQQQQEKPTNKPMERVIPIHVEGRDEPVIPKHTGPSFSQQPPPQPQPERIFGHRPSQFTQFVGREPRQYGAGPEWHHPAYTKQEPIPTDNMKQQQQQQQKFQQQQQKSQEQVPPQQQQQQQQQQEQEQPQPQPPKQGNNPIDIIQAIQKDVSELMGQVEKFNGVPRDKQYLYLDEMLTRNLIKLDNVDTQGQENIRQARKEAIKCIESCISILDAKAAANVPQTPKETTEEKMEETNVDNQVEEAKTEGCQEKVEESPQTKPEESQPKVEESQNKIEELQPLPAPEDNKMEVTEDKPAETVAEPPQQQPPPPEEDKMEVVSEPTIPTIPSSEPIPLHPPKEIIEEKPKEETSEKPDEEMKDVPQEDKKENEVKEENKEDNDDKKEKKKGKKKVIKK